MLILCSMQPRRVWEEQEGILVDYTCLTQFWEAIQQNTPQKCIPCPAGELDNSTGASYSSIIQLTPAAQRSHCAIQQQIQYKRSAALKPKECRRFSQGETSCTRSTGARSAEHTAGQPILWQALKCTSALWKFNNIKIWNKGHRVF